MDGTGVMEQILKNNTPQNHIIEVTLVTRGESMTFQQHLNNLVHLELSGINLHGKLSALRYMQRGFLSLKLRQCCLDDADLAQLIVTCHQSTLPKHLYLQEINGGIGSASEHRIRYFQNNKEDHDNDSDNDSEDSDEIMTASQMIQISDRSAIATITECIFLLHSDRIHFSEVKTQEDWIVIYQMEKLRDHMASSLGFESEFRMPFASQNRS